MSMRVDRVKNVQAALRASRTKTERGVERGLTKAGLFIQRISQEVVPVQFGPLKASANTRKEGSGYRTIIIVSYGTIYAVFVHENQDAAHGAAFNAKHADKIAANTFVTKRGKEVNRHPMWFNRGPNQTAKYLERPIRQNRQRIRDIVFTEAQK